MSQWRGRRPPEAGNRARQIRSERVWLGIAALGLGGFAARVAPDLAELSAQDAKHTFAADEHTLERDPRPMGDAQARVYRG